MDKAQMPLLEAATLALEVVGLLADVCERVAIAGSIRRGKALVGDIESVCSPVSEVALYRRMDELLREGVLQKRLKKNGTSIAWGQRYRAAVYRDFPLDVFIVLADRQWGPTLLLRTGPGDANQVLVTRVGVRTSAGELGVLPPGLKWQEGALRRLNSSYEQLDTPEEADVFYACGLPWVAPHLRSVETYQILAARTSRQVPGGDCWVGAYPPIPDGLYWPDEEGRVRAQVLHVPNLAAARVDAPKTQQELFHVPEKINYG
jgi:DNA polymerase/3'-5' exonuclease PolX